MFADNESVNKCNLKNLNSLDGEFQVIKSINDHPTIRDYVPPIGKNGTVGETPFMAELQLKKEARVMLVYNIDTADLLCNGAKGTVKGWVNNSKGNITTVFVKFDDEEAGVQCRKNYTFSNEEIPDDWTPITRTEFTYSVE